jgi:hypothetical protein
MNSQAQTVVKIIAAGAIEAINNEGRNFHVVFAPVDIQIKTPGGEFVTFPQGTGEDNQPDNGTFKRLEVRNPSLGPITVVIYIGGPLYRDNRSAIIEPRTEFGASPITTLAITTGATFSGVPAGLRIRRKGIQVTNSDPNLNLQVMDQAGNVGLEVFPKTSITLPVSETITIYNPNASAVSCRISEIWWTL